MGRPPRCQSKETFWVLDSEAGVGKKYKKSGKNKKSSKNTFLASGTYLVVTGVVDLL